MRYYFRKLLIINTLIIAPWLGFAQKESQKFITNELIIKGLVENPMTISVQKLTERKIYEKGEYIITNHEGKPKRTIANFKGVLLKDLLLEAKIKLTNPKD
jgi:DMSO/TMAO reductase YedYZ molybdopterin-dependent catalytic subunit